MAKVTIKMPDEFLLKVSRLGEHTDVIVEVALEKGGQVALDRVRSNLAGVIGKGTKKPSRSTGTLLGALGLSPVKPGRNGNHDIKVGLSEPRRGGGVNAKIANILEYGRHGQPPRPFLRPAKRTVRASCIEAMQNALDEEVRRIWGS